MQLENKVCIMDAVSSTYAGQNISEEAEFGFHPHFISSLHDHWMREKRRRGIFNHSFIPRDLYADLVNYRPMDRRGYLPIYSLAVLVADTDASAAIYGRTDRVPGLRDMMSEVEADVRREAEAYRDACVSGKGSDPSRLITAAIRNAVLKMPLMIVAMVIGQDAFSVAIESVTPGNEYSLAAFPNIKVVSYIPKTLAALKWKLSPESIHQIIIQATSFILSARHMPVVLFTDPLSDSMCVFMPVHPSWTISGNPGIAWCQPDPLEVIREQLAPTSAVFWGDVSDVNSFVDLVQGALSIPANIYYFRNNTIRCMEFDTKIDRVFCDNIPQSLVFAGGRPTGLSVQSAVISYLMSFGRVRVVNGYYVPVSYLDYQRLPSIVPDVVLQSPPANIEDVSAATSTLINHLNICRFAYMLSHSKGLESPRSPSDSIAICLYLEKMALGDILGSVKESSIPYPMRVKECVTAGWRNAASDTIAQLLRVDATLSPPSDECCLAIRYKRRSLTQTDWWANNISSTQVVEAIRLLRKIVDPTTPPQTKQDLVTIISIIVYVTFLRNIGKNGIQTFEQFRIRHLANVSPDLIDMSMAITA